MTKVGLALSVAGIAVAVTGGALLKYQKVDGANIGAGGLVFLGGLVALSGVIVAIVGFLTRE
jgi:hypothetical protein